ncbi:hypothetical protein EVJ58_g10871 [Rhodofomes roseus]|uniref:Uncharacterized protein n=1 Tax=Rhodofomes roseus TaxID=34475 RepID=A0A4Y9XQM1_9APHY|nr:hypothetical protein EVJ58_g10871 [Rhodofomes roseus]
MFFAFSSGKSNRIPAHSPAIQAHHNGHNVARPGQPATSVFDVSPRITKTHTSYMPCYAVAVDVFVKPLPETDVDNQQETWIVDIQPPRQLTRGHIVTVRTANHVIGAGRISKTMTLTRHWITLRLAGRRDGLQIRVPIPWARLCDLDGYSHTVLFRALQKLPAPHHTFLTKPAFHDPDHNPYEFDISPNATARLRARMKKDTKTKELLESLSHESTNKARPHGEGEGSQD